MLNPFEASGVNEHEAKEAAVAATDVGDSKATALVSMTKSDKEKLTAIAKAYGLNLSAFFRLAVDEYIAGHDW